MPATGLADMRSCTAHVGFQMQSGHALLHRTCTLMTQSGHRNFVTSVQLDTRLVSCQAWIRTGMKSKRWLVIATYRASPPATGKLAATALNSWRLAPVAVLSAEQLHGRRRK